MIKPKKWVNLDQQEFYSWLNETFDKYRMDLSKTKSKTESKDEFEPYQYQKLMRDYMQLDSPYRGILLYHGLGSGKTCSSIVISEILKSEKNIIVMLPASLKTNYINDGLKKCGDPSYRNSGGNEIISNKIEFLKNKKKTYKLMNIKLKTKVSKGTYIRQLAKDIGEKIGNLPAMLYTLKRTKVGEISLNEAIETSQLEIE